MQKMLLKEESKHLVSMSRKPVKKEDLIKYCKRHNIFIPKGVVKIEYLTSAIHRMLMHGQAPELTIGCYGYWEEDDVNCVTCEFASKCFTQSMGMPEEEYMKKYKKSGDKILNLEDNFRGDE